MTNQELLQEIRMNREEIKKLHQDFYVFQGKAYGVIALLSVVINVGLSFVNKGL